MKTYFDAFYLLAIGNSISGGGVNRLLHQDASTGALAADADFTWDATNNRLTIGNAKISSPHTSALFIGVQPNAGYTGGGTYSDTWIGMGAGAAQTTGNSNTGVGYLAGNDLTTGLSNTLVGAGAGGSIIGGSYNIAIGYNAGALLTAGNDNALIGESAGLFNTGSNNMLIGRNSGKGASGVSTGYNNVGVGGYTLFGLTSGYRNVGIGASALEGVTSGLHNVAIGDQAALGITTGSQNVLLGAEAGRLIATASNCVFLGYQAGYNETTSRRLYIADSSTTTPLIYGEFDNRVLYFHALEMRQRYDVATYLKTTVDSTGIVTFDAVNGTGTGKSVFNNDVDILAGKRLTVTHDATKSAFRLAPTAGDPSAPANGDIWYNSSLGKFRKYEAGAASDLGAAAGGGGVSDGDKGDITVSSSGSVWTIDNAAVTLAKQADMATSSLVYRKTASAGAPEINTLATLKTDLGLTGINSGDQTSIVGITGTKAQFNTAITDDSIIGEAGGTFTGDISVPDEVYNATAWDGSLEVPTKNALRDKIETLSGGSPGGTSGAVQYNNAGAFAGADNVEITTDGNLCLVGTTNPTTPATGLLTIYARSIANRMMPKWLGPSGVDTYAQPALFGNRIITFNPNTGTVGTGQGLGPAWTSNGTVFHPTPINTAPALSNQMKRTRYANIVTTTNQQLGPRFNVDSERQFWRGNAAGLGGFFFSTRFIVELYPAATVRLFAGLQGASATGSIVISDTVTNNTCGLWHSTVDPSSGANSFNFVTRDATTTTKQSIALTNAIAAGNSYEFHMFCAPNGTTIYWRLYDIVNNVNYEGNQTLTLPVNTVFMSPQVQMSNGTANIAVTTSAIGVAGIYVESDN